MVSRTQRDVKTAAQSNVPVTNAGLHYTQTNRPTMNTTFKPKVGGRSAGDKCRALDVLFFLYYLLIQKLNQQVICTKCHYPVKTNIKTRVHT